MRCWRLKTNVEVLKIEKERCDVENCKKPIWCWRLKKSDEVLKTERNRYDVENWKKPMWCWKLQETDVMLKTEKKFWGVEDWKKRNWKNRCDVEDFRKKVKIWSKFFIQLPFRKYSVTSASLQSLGKQIFNCMKPKNAVLTSSPAAQ